MDVNLAKGTNLTMDVNLAMEIYVDWFFFQSRGFTDSKALINAPSYQIYIMSLLLTFVAKLFVADVQHACSGKTNRHFYLSSHLLTTSRPTLSGNKMF